MDGIGRDKERGRNAQGQRLVKSLPWKWIVPVFVVTFLLWRVTLVFAGLIDEANDARDNTLRLEAAIVALEEDTVRSSQAKDSTEAAHAALDSAAAVARDELAGRNEELEGTIRDLIVQDEVNEESVDVALRDLGAVLNPEAVPALRVYTLAWQTRLGGLQDRIVFSDSILANFRTDIVVVEGQRDRSIERESAANVLLDGLRPLLVQKDSIIGSQNIEIGALRAAVVPGFIQRIMQMPEVALFGVVVGGVITYIVVKP